jgi:hypothetical protein
MGGVSIYLRVLNLAVPGDTYKWRFKEVLAYTQLKGRKKGEKSQKRRPMSISSAFRTNASTHC